MMKTVPSSDPSQELLPGRRNAALGGQGEEIAAAFLQRLHYRILQQNYRCKGGEIDIVALDRRTLVFVEVKTRRGCGAFGPPQAAVTPFKQRQISKAALTWLAQQKRERDDARFDVVAVTLEKDGAHIEHFRNAFDLNY